MDRFPFAFAPDIIRSQQKDTYIENVLKDKLVDIIQKVKGTRFLHNHSLEITSASNLVYLCLTTILGARTLGEEYVDIFHVTRSGQNLPSWKRRAGYVLSTSLGPILILRLFKRRMSSSRIMQWIQRPDTIQGLLTFHLSLFYFFGAYYQFAKRVWGLRYAFGHQLNPMETRGGYELLGVLILAQYMVRGIANTTKTEPEETQEIIQEDTIDLSDRKILPYIPPNSRKCTLCLEFLKNPAATLCGHIFCWTCGSEWCREKPECPLCRQECLEQNLLPLKA